MIARTAHTDGVEPVGRHVRQQSDHQRPAAVSADTPAQRHESRHGGKDLTGVVNDVAMSRPPVSAPARVDWVPDAVITACGSALKQIDGPQVASLGVTSAVRGEGRTTVAAGAALVQRDEYGRRTLLVELDLERPSFATRFGLGDGPGVAELFRREASAPACVHWIDDHLGVVAAGDPRGQQARILAGLLDTGVMEELASSCDVLIADLPPLPPSGLGDRVADAFETVVLVIEAGATPMPVVSRAAEALERPPAVILNRTRSAVPRWLRRRIGG